MKDLMDSLWAELGKDERLVIVEIAKRLHMGRVQYGDLHLATDRRNWRAELRSELLDALVYDAAEMLSTGTVSGPEENE